MRLSLSFHPQLSVIALWQASKRSEDLANWLQAQNQLRITATHLGKRSEVEVGVYE
jgi:hypothetical protein